MMAIRTGYFGDKIALDDVRNNSTCVKEETGIRNIESEDDLHKTELVFVNNIAPEEITVDVIEVGSMVRYKKISVV